MILLLISTLVVLFLFHELFWKRRNLPPGPTPWPVIGNIYQIFSGETFDVYETFRKWRKQYGPVYTYWLGFEPVVAISEFKAIRDSVIKDGDNYAERYVNENMIREFRGGPFGIIFSSGGLWKDQRRFALHTLRDFGMGRNIMEERVMIEVEYILERLAKQKTAIHLQIEFDTAIGSVINNILFGYRFDETKQEEFRLLKNMLQVLIVSLSTPGFLIGMHFPIFQNLPFVKKRFAQVYAARDGLFDFIRAQIKQKKKLTNYDSDSYNDFVECYLQEWHRRKGTDAENYCFDKQLENVVLDIWAAGMETTSNTLTWAFCYLLNYPEVQRKLHDELDRVVQSDRKITLADKHQLHYVNAFISEVQRMANLLPQNLMRYTSTDVVVCGQKIPAHTAIVPMISAVLYDDKIFPEPYEFRPERFLNPDGTYKHMSELVPFSVGKRQCVGEGLAKVELYLFVANIVQRFELLARTKPSMKKNIGNVVTAAKYLCDVKERFVHVQ